MEQQSRLPWARPRAPSTGAPDATCRAPPWARHGRIHQSTTTGVVAWWQQPPQSWMRCGSNNNRNAPMLKIHDNYNRFVPSVHVWGDQFLVEANKFASCCVSWVTVDLHECRPILPPLSASSMVKSCPANFSGLAPWWR